MKIELRLRDSSLVYILGKTVLYLVLIALAVMVEDDGESKVAWILGIIVAESTLALSGKSRRFWKGPALSFLLGMFFLLLWSLRGGFSEAFKT